MFNRIYPLSVWHFTIASECITNTFPAKVVVVATIWWVNPVVICESANTWEITTERLFFSLAVYVNIKPKLLIILNIVETSYLPCRYFKRRYNNYRFVTDFISNATSILL